MEFTLDAIIILGKSIKNGFKRCIHFLPSPIIQKSINLPIIGLMSFVKQKKKILKNNQCGLKKKKKNRAENLMLLQRDALYCQHQGGTLVPL
jgi:hypothetical protein